MPAAFMRMRLAAKQNPHRVWFNLMHQMKVGMLKRAFHGLDDKKARGVDGVSKAQYGRDLEANLGRLENQLHRGSWKPQPMRRVMIPKAGGGKRPLAIASVEDKIVQKAAAEILETIFEPIFCESSHGFRPQRGAHSAVKALHGWLANRTHSHVVDIDIEKFFDTIDHEKLMEILKKRISDRRFLRLIRRLLKAEVLTAEGVLNNTTGTPQGSVISPILANIFLHEVIDQWLVEEKSARRWRLIRYADDMVICTGRRQEAQKCLVAIEKRLADYGLRLNRDKSHVVPFERGGREIFHFLGFRWYWGMDRKRRPLLKLKTQTERFRRSIKEFTRWIKENRNRKRLKVLWKEAGEKMRGHFAYYGVQLNTRLYEFYQAVCQALFKWLNRRSQKPSFTWTSFQARMKRMPLPKPWGCNMVNIRQRDFVYAI